MHGPICPCCAPRRGAGVGGLFELVGAALLVVAIGTGRFLSGRPLLRRVGPADSTYTAWAPPVPAGVALMRVVVPRTSWGRRPGWHRQAVRLLAVAVAVAFLVVPVVTVAALAGAGFAGAAGWLAWARQLAAPDAAAALGPLAARAGMRGRRWDALSRRWPETPHEPHERVSGFPGAAQVTVRATARRMDRGGAW